MKITNNAGLPDPVYDAITRSGYERGTADRTVTELIDSPRIVALRAMHGDIAQPRDISDMVNAFVGTALHFYLEHHGDLTEERLYAELDGWVISGQIDLQEEGAVISVVDWKCTSVWSIVFDDRRRSWEKQLNLYEWLRVKNGKKPADKLSIIAFLRDWTQSKAGERNYPPASIMEVAIPNWGLEKQEQFVRDRIAMHKQASEAAILGTDMPLCSDEDRWAKGGSFAVMKHGQKRAVKLFETEAEAQEFAKQQTFLTRIDRREKNYVRCERNFCGVAEFCDQWKGSKDGQAKQNK